MQAPGGDYSSTDQYKFLRALSEGCPAGLYFQVTLKVGEFWDTWAWDGEPLKPGAWFFYSGASDRRKRRRDEDTHAVRAIVLDDVGTKVPREKVLATPTWTIETSPGNFQWGFLLGEWSTDIGRANALMDGLASAGLGDKTIVKACRVWRMPGSVNDKEGREPFEAVLHSFDKDIVYTLDSLTKALQVKPGKVVPPRERPAVPPAAGEPDPVFNWLADNGYVLGRRNGAGWWPITCPFAEEHEADPRTEAKYMQRGDSDIGIGVVYCEHGHGQGPRRSGYTQRFFDWVVNQHGPSNQGHTPDIPEETRRILREMATGSSPSPEPPPAPPPEPPSPPEPPPSSAGFVPPRPPHPHPYDFITLRQALGLIDIGKLANLEHTDAGKVKAIQPTSAENVESGLQLLKVRPRLNLMTADTSYILPERIELERFGHKADYEISDMVHGSLEDVFGRGRMKNKKELADALARIANSQFWHPMQDWILSKPWDGQDRLDDLCKSVPTPTPVLFKVYLRRWLLQGVEAACGWDAGRRKSQKGMVLVLVGKQRIGKTRWFSSLAPDFASIGKHLNLSSRDSIHEALQGVIVELGEIDATFKKAEISALKAFITNETDEYRLPYAQGWLRRPRCASFCGTVNDPKFLSDPTGNGRFLPIEVDGKIDVDHAVDVQQLWAQVHADWLKGEQWWLTEAEEEMRDEHVGDFEVISPVAELIEESLQRRQDEEQHPVKVIIGPRAMLELCHADFMNGKLLGIAGLTMERLLGKGRNLIRRGAPTKMPRWVVNASMREVQDFKLVLYKPATA